jgi:hypothetical protein
MSDEIGFRKTDLTLQMPSEVPPVTERLHALLWCCDPCQTSLRVYSRPSEGLPQQDSSICRSCGSLMRLADVKTGSKPTPIDPARASNKVTAWAA